MTDLLSPTGQTIASFVVIVAVGWAGVMARQAWRMWR